MAGTGKKGAHKKELMMASVSKWKHCLTYL
jgi:hypothetical protein